MKYDVQDTIMYKQISQIEVIQFVKKELIIFTPFMPYNNPVFRAFPMHFSQCLLLLPGNLYLSPHTAGRTVGDVSNVVCLTFL